MTTIGFLFQAADFLNAVNFILLFSNQKLGSECKLK